LEQRRDLTPEGLAGTLATTKPLDPEGGRRRTARSRGAELRSIGEGGRGERGRLRSTKDPPTSPKSHCRRTSLRWLEVARARGGR
jgi:hypothetical protein